VCAAFGARQPGQGSTPLADAPNRTISTRNSLVNGKIALELVGRGSVGDARGRILGEIRLHMLGHGPLKFKFRSTQFFRVPTDV
jgi:hypothetical protein